MQEIQTVENDKLQLEPRLGLFWEHPPAALDPEAVGKMMQSIRDCIRGLEDRKRALLEKENELMVRGACLRYWGD